MSPAIDSIAKSSSSEPITVPSGSFTTWYCAVSGIAPPLPIATILAARRPLSFLFTASRKIHAPRRPRVVAIPSESIVTSSSNSVRGRSRYGHARVTSS